MDMSMLTSAIIAVTIVSVLVVIGGVLVAVFLVRRQNQQNPPRDLDQDD